MSERQIAAIILGAGKGTRMKSDKPKVLMPVCKKAMIRHIIDSLEKVGVSKIVTVIAPDGDLVKKEVAPYPTCVQEKQLGTGHAVLAARPELLGFHGDIFVIFGDTPLITPETFKNIIAKRREGYALVVLGFRPKDPARYGRLVINDKGDLERIVEFKDASEEEKKIDLCNSGLMCFNGETMFEILAMISNENAAGEYYLTDAVEIARRRGLKCSVAEGDPEEVASANTPEELALLETFLQKRKGK